MSALLAEAADTEKGLKKTLSAGALVALAAHKRGPKVDLQAEELARLQRDIAKLQAKLQRADLIIDAQKKLLVLLNLPIPDVPELT